MSSINRVLRGLLNEAQRRLHEESALPPSDSSHPYTIPPNLRLPMGETFSHLESFCTPSSVPTEHQTITATAPEMYNRLSHFLHSETPWSPWCASSSLDARDKLSSYYQSQIGAAGISYNYTLSSCMSLTQTPPAKVDNVPGMQLSHLNAPK